MFGRRKTRKQEEPLVPHGLIWQATDEPEEPAQPAKLEKPASSAEVIQMSRRENLPNAALQAATVLDSQSREVAQVDGSASRMGAISPPIPWPSPKTASVIRRAPPPTIPVITSSPIAANLAELDKREPQVVPQAPAVSHDAVIEVPAAAAQVHKHSRRRDNLTQIGRSLHQKVKNAYSGATQTLVIVRGKAQTTYAAINPRAKFTSALQLAKKNSLVAIAACWAGGNRVRSAWATVSPRLGRLKADGRTSVLKVFRILIWRYGYLVQRARTQRIRIRIEGPASTRAFIEHSKLAWAKGRESIRRESRLWTSVGMGALSALLAVGVISAVSRNAPGAHASSKSVANAHESNSSAVNPIVVLAPRISDSRQRTKASRPTPYSASAPANAPKAQDNTPQKSRVRHARPADDDYVAPDTYHYYGPSGKSKQ